MSFKSLFVAGILILAVSGCTTKPKTEAEWLNYAVEYDLCSVPKELRTNQNFIASYVLRKNGHSMSLKVVEYCAGLHSQTVQAAFMVNKEIAVYVADYLSSFLTDEMVYWIFKHGNYRAINSVPNRKIGNEHISVLLRRDKNELANISDNSSHKLSDLKVWDTTLAQAAFQKNPALIIIIPKQFRSYEMYKKAVSKDGMLLSEVPWKMRFKNNGELSRLAVRNNDAAAKYVPKYFMFDFSKAAQ